MQFLEPHWLERVTSTNTVLLQRLDAGEPLPAGLTLAAREQTAGRGRGAHQWRAQAERDLCFSFVCRTGAPARQLASLAMATALGLIDCLRGFNIDARAKWPNDVLVAASHHAGADAKIAGILCELRPGVAVVGVGLNVSMSAGEAEQIDQPATSMLMQTGEAVAPREVLPLLLEALAPRLEIWAREGFAGLREDWSQACIALGEEITIDDGDSQQKGVLSGFGDAGQLLLQPHGAGPATSPVEIWSGHLRRCGQSR